MGRTRYPRLRWPADGPKIVGEPRLPRGRPVAVVGVLAGAVYLVIWRRTCRVLRDLRADRPIELDDPDVALEG